MIILHLKLRTARGEGRRLIEFLRNAVPLYERPGGIRMKLLRSVNDPDTFLEIAEYRNRELYDRDQLRVDSDPEMRMRLEAWRKLLDAPVVVETYEDVSSDIR